MKKQNNKKEKNKKSNSQTINLDNEIIIGLNTKTSENNSTKQKKKKNKKPQKTKKKPQKKEQNNKEKQRRKKTIKKWIILIIMLIVAILLILLSDLFNCKKIEVIGNSKIPAETIINLSGIKQGENIFKINTVKSKKSIKQNPYINIVKIKRKLDGTVEIEIEERVATYMLTYEEGCMYINNQGYILEKSEQPIMVPTIIGFKTDLTTKKPGERLEKEDLLMLEKIIKITDISAVKGLKEIITNINVSDKQDIQIYIDSEKKTIHFGNENNANKKFDRIKVVMEYEQGKEGEIYAQDIEDIYFREKV